MLEIRPSGTLTVPSFAVRDADRPEPVDYESLGYEPFIEEAHRPGETPRRFTNAHSGLAEDLDALDPDDVVIDTEGAIVRYPAPKVIALREERRVETSRLKKVWFALRRRVDTDDPEEDAVRCGICWMDRWGNELSGASAFTAISDAPLHAADGRRIVSATIGTAAGGLVTHVAPAGTVYARPYVELFGFGGETDIEVIAWEDVTDAGTISPDVTALDARLDTLESLDAGPRLTAVETAVTGAEIARYKTHAIAKAAGAAGTIPASVDQIETLGISADGDQVWIKMVRAPSDPLPGQLLAINPATHTKIGNATGNGGLAAAFDGVTSQTGAASASRAGALSAWVGLLFTEPKRVGRIVAYGSNDIGYISGGDPPITLNARAKVGGPLTTSDLGSIIGTTGEFADTPNESGGRTMNSTDYMRRCDSAGVEGTTAVEGVGWRFAEVVIYEYTGEFDPALNFQDMGAGGGWWVVADMRSVEVAHVPSLADLATRSLPSQTQIVWTGGRGRPGDGGHAPYVRRGAAPGHLDAAQDGEGMWWERSSWNEHDVVEFKPLLKRFLDPVDAWIYAHQLLFDPENPNRTKLKCEGIPMVITHPALIRPDGIDLTFIGSPYRHREIDDFFFVRSDGGVYTWQPGDYVCSVSGKTDSDLGRLTWAKYKGVVDANGGPHVAVHLSGFQHLTVDLEIKAVNHDAGVGLYLSDHYRTSGTDLDGQMINTSAHGLVLERCDIAGDGSNPATQSIAIISEVGDANMKGGWINKTGKGILIRRQGFNTLGMVHFSMGPDANGNRRPAVICNHPNACSFKGDELDWAYYLFDAGSTDNIVQVTEPDPLGGPPIPVPGQYGVATGNFDRISVTDPKFSAQEGKPPLDRGLIHFTTSVPGTTLSQVNHPTYDWAAVTGGPVPNVELVKYGVTGAGSYNTGNRINYRFTNGAGVNPGNLPDRAMAAIAELNRGWVAFDGNSPGGAGLRLGEGLLGVLTTVPPIIRAKGDSLRFGTHNVLNNDPVDRVIIPGDGGPTQLLTGARIGVAGVQSDIIVRNGGPEGVVTAEPGSMVLQKDGGAGKALWSKRGGTGNSGWMPVNHLQGVQIIATDADFSLAMLTSQYHTIHTGTLTADRTITPSTLNAYAGLKWKVTRTGGGAFNLIVGGLKNLATNQWCEVTFNGTAYVLTAFGSL